VPALIDASLFRAAQEQLRENRSRARLGRKRPGYLLQGLTCCAICGYAYYGKTLHQRGVGGIFRDFHYYRCSGSDGYRFGGERVCSNAQVQGEFIDTAVWREISNLLANPERLERECQAEGKTASFVANGETLRAERLKLQHTLERLIDSFTEGLIEKDQFTSRMSRAKCRITELDAQLEVGVGSADQQTYVRSVIERLREIAKSIGELGAIEWARKREIIRLLVHKIEIEQAAIKLIFRVLQEKHCSGLPPIVVTILRPNRAKNRSFAA
jgi:site-specific DNA recombinase